MLTLMLKCYAVQISNSFGIFCPCYHLQISTPHPILTSGCWNNLIGLQHMPVMNTTDGFWSHYTCLTSWLSTAWFLSLVCLFSSPIPTQTTPGFAQTSRKRQRPLKNSQELQQLPCLKQIRAIPVRSEKVFCWTKLLRHKIVCEIQQQEKMLETWLWL